MVCQGEMFGIAFSLTNAVSHYFFAGSLIDTLGVKVSLIIGFGILLISRYASGFEFDPLSCVATAMYTKCKFVCMQDWDSVRYQQVCDNFHSIYFVSLWISIGDPSATGIQECVWLFWLLLRIQFLPACQIAVKRYTFEYFDTVVRTDKDGRPIRELGNQSVAFDLFYVMMNVSAAIVGPVRARLTMSAS